jgi:oxidase EvaA
MNSVETLAWIAEHKGRSKFSIREIPFQESKEWSFLPEKEALAHKSGRFFAIRGYRATTASGETFDQPLIHQWEIGIQAFLVRNEGSDLEVLMQAKTEPGNIGITQISPTLQVTRSNLQGVHDGAVPKFADLFLDLSDKKVLINQKYPELGNRYYKKWNENIILSTVDVIEEGANFRWLPIQTLKELLHHDNVINNDARLVLSLLFLKYGNTFMGPSTSFQEKLLKSWNSFSGISFQELIKARAWLEHIRKRHFLLVKKIPLPQLVGWKITDNRIVKEDHTQYSIMQLAVESDEREVSSWDQPIINTCLRGLTGLICKEFGGVLHVLFEASPQIGNHQGAELLPSICSDGTELNEIQSEIYQLVMETEDLVGKCIYSEEGGRFFRDDSLVRIILIDNLDIVLPENYCWLTIGQIRKLCSDSHFFSDEARGALAILLSYM